METKSKLLSWKNRKVNLENIERYHKFKVMFYRTNNLVHTRRVLGLLKELLPFVKDVLEIDVKLAELIAIHHDDHEIILEGGDIPLQTKLMMNNEELSILEQEELFVIETLSDFYPKKINMSHKT